MNKCPDISQITIQRALIALQEQGKIIKIGGGRYTKYTWNWDKQQQIARQTINPIYKFRDDTIVLQLLRDFLI